MSKTKKRRRRNVSFFNLRNVQQNLEQENNEPIQISELRDIASELAPDSPLDIGFFIPNNESIISDESSNIQNI
jgi:hypothetical protein